MLGSNFFGFRVGSGFEFRALGRVGLNPKSKIYFGSGSGNTFSGRVSGFSGNTLMMHNSKEFHAKMV